jgi:ribosome biogenesis GTPase
MLEFDFESLSALGLTPALADRASAIDVPRAAAARLARVTEVHRETVTVHDGRTARGARALPRLTRSLAELGTALAVGDWVVATVESSGDAWLAERVPPSSHIARRDGDGRSHPVVSNVDIALLVMGLDDDFNPRRLERYLALVHADGVTPVAVLTKLDIAAQTPGLPESRIAALRGRIPGQVDMVSVDATHASAAGALRHHLARGRTLVLLGSSGAGKSTLTNTLVGAAVQDTGPTREPDGRGRHTTTARALHLLPGGACIVDTPGLRALRPDADESTVARSFAEVEVLATRCRFRDCSHAHEPGCAVRDGVDPDRLRNYHKLLRETRRDTLTALDRQRQLADWKARGRLARARLRSKRGEKP